MGHPTISFDSLPYIDSDPTPAERAAAQSLIAAEIGENPLSEHPSLPSPPNENFSSIVRAEFERIQSKIPLNAIDLSRYESIEPPINFKNESNDWHAALRTAYVSHTYLSNRNKNLESLEKFGKNAWLLGNAQLETILRHLEQDLAQKKTEIDLCVIARKSAQDSVAGEIRVLGETWKRGVGRALETEIAAENLRLNMKDQI